MSEYWGYHLILDCKGCDKEKISSKDVIVNFTKSLVSKIDMVAFGEPTVQHFATHNPHAAGYSLVQLIETSSITGHFVDSNGDAYIDIFSCKPFDEEVAKSVVASFFGPNKVKATFLKRQA